MTHIVVIGAGSWGSAIATALMRAKQQNSEDQAGYRSGSSSGEC